MLTQSWRNLCDTVYKMWTLITIFIASLLAMLGMLLHRAWQIKAGRVFVDEAAPQKMIIPEITFASMKKNVLYFAKRATHTVAMTFINLWVRGTHKVSKQVEKISNKIVKKSEETGEKTNISSFLVTVSEYKKKARRLRERIKREEHPDQQM